MKSLREILPWLDHCTRHSFELTRRQLVKGGVGGGVLAAGSSGLATLAGSAEAHAGNGRGMSSGQCDNLVPAATGGQAPADRNVISLRWLGCACFELVYRNQVILLDTWYDRPLCRDIGLTPQQVTKANLIVIGHAHFDHIADAASIALRTGATVIADQTIGNGLLLSQGLPARQIRAVNGLGGELLRFNGFTVQPILAHHSVPPTSVNAEGETAGQEVTDIYLAQLNPPFTSTDLEAAATVVARGSLDPRILTQGTIAYLFTFDSGYRLMWLDSGGPITPTLQAAMETIKSTNLAIVGYNVQAVPRFQVPVTMQLVELFNPDLFFPAHHDELLSSLDGKSLLALPDMATEPLFLAVRDLLPKTSVVSALYRTPVLVDIQNGEFSVGDECEFDALRH
jgi:L-ascorbate metabolism protein UlaG (beta-lactamase superfamily)